MDSKGINYPYLVSVLLPFRENVDMVVESLKSLYLTAKEVDRVEILIKIDDDDEVSLSRINEYKDIFPNTKILISSRRDGYNSFHLFLNELCSISEGEFLFLWNDDVFMKKRNWDEKLLQYQGQEILIEPKTNNIIFPYTFPILHRTLYEHMGVFSELCLCDAWIYDVLFPLGLVTIIEDIVVHHNQYDGVQDYSQPQKVYFSEIGISKREAMMNKIAEIYGIKPDYDGEEYREFVWRLYSPDGHALK